MIAKEFLQQAYRLDLKIETDLDELERLRELASTVKTVNLDREPVQSSSQGSQVENTIIRIVDLETKINAEIDEYLDTKKRIRELIEKVPNVDERMILQKRYINFQKWEQIAVDMGFSFQYAHILHKRALRNFPLVD